MNKILRNLIRSIVPEKTKKVSTVITNYTDIKTFDDACEALGLCKKDVKQTLNDLLCVYGYFGEHLVAIYKLGIIKKALNGKDWQPKMIKGKSYYTVDVKFYKNDWEIPVWKNTKVIGDIIIDGQKYILVVGSAYHPYGNGICSYTDNHIGGIQNVELGVADFNYGMVCCKSKEIAEYMSMQFGKLIFDACYGQYVGSYHWVK